MRLRFRSRSSSCSSCTRWSRSSIAACDPTVMSTSGRCVTSSPTRRRAASCGSRSGRPRSPPSSPWSLALPGAYVLARLRFPGRTLVRALVTIPFVMPTVLVAQRVPRPRRGALARRDPARAHLLQLRGRGAGRRRAVATPRSAGGGGGAAARREPVARVPGSDAAGVAARHRRRGDHHLPLLLHLVRRDPAARRPHPVDDRDRDLPPDDALPRPPARGRAVDRAAPDGHRAAVARGSVRAPRRGATPPPRRRARWSTGPGRSATDCCSSRTSR